jgi:hypothetical protein
MSNLSSLHQAAVAAGNGGVAACTRDQGLSLPMLEA